MFVKTKGKLLACMLLASITFSGDAAANELKGTASFIYSPHKTHLSAKGYLASLGAPPKDHENEGDGYYGFFSELRYGKFAIGADYLTGTSDTVEGGLAFTEPTFNPLTHETSEVLRLYTSYKIIENSFIGDLEPTIGYFRMWASPSLSPPNWYDGIEYGIKGRCPIIKNIAIEYKLAYVPTVSLHGYLKDHHLMTGENLVSYRIGATVPVFDGCSVVGGYERVRAENNVVVDGSLAIVKFSGFYVGGSYSF